MGVSRLNVFVYGTLKPGERYHAVYCREGLVEARPAVAQGILYHLPTPHCYPAMIEGRGWVQGYVLSFSYGDVLLRLDELEDYDSTGPAVQNLYERRWIEARLTRPDSEGGAHQNQKTANDQNILASDRTMQKAQCMNAWAYFMKPEKVQAMGGVLLQSGNWNMAQISKLEG